MRRLAAYPRQNALAKALREIGRLERTLFTLDWISDPALRRRANAGLNKGEAHHALKRAVFFHRLGEIRDRTFENQSYRASGLNLAVAAIILWNTVYIGRAVDELRSRGETVPDELVAEQLGRALTGAWVETASTSARAARPGVAPSRARGLKPPRGSAGKEAGRVAPSRARGLKLLHLVDQAAGALVAPSRARGLKPPSERRPVRTLASRELTR